MQLKNQPDISDSSDLTKTNRLSITRQENRALDECRGELGASTVMRKTGYADNHRAMRRRKNRVRGMRRGKRKKRGFHLAIDTRRYHSTFSLTLSVACHSCERSNITTEMRGRENVQWATVEKVGDIGREIARNGKLWSDDSTMRHSALETTRMLTRSF